MHDTGFTLFGDGQALFPTTYNRGVRTDDDDDAEEEETDGRTGPQEKINPKKSCRTNGHVCALLTGLGNMPKAILTLNEFVPSVPFWQN